MGRRRPGAGLIAALLLVGCAEHRRRDDDLRYGTWHRVEPGESLSLIASRFRVPVEDLVARNALADPDRIAVGRMLFIPRHAAAAAPLHRAHPTHRPPALIARGSSAPPSGTARSVALGWPVSAPISSPFGERDGRPHDGIDLPVADGTAVHAAAAGEVVYAGDELRGYGRLVILRHDPRLLTVYAHNSKLLVGEGQRVAAGEVIALSGHTGNATAPHLHFEVREGGVPLDPERLLPARAAAFLHR